MWVRVPWLPLALLAACLLPSPAFAQSGVFELSDAHALAGDASDPAGYPIEIRRSGSYRLTSDLNVPAGVDGISVLADDVQIDLNGFTIRGPEACFPRACLPASSSGGIVGGHRATIEHGGVSGFGGSCILLRDGGRVENVRVYSCGGRGIHLRTSSGDAGAAFRNHVENTGLAGITLEGGGLFRDNIVVGNGLASPSLSIEGGTATGGNFCGDGRCSKRGMRRYYLTKGGFNGSQALTACPAPYHMASRWELLDPSGLEYDTVLGQTVDDSGTGPPAATPAASGVGWARMGTPSSADPAVAALGSTNCRNWASSSGSDVGTVLLLLPWLGQGAPAAPWSLGSHACSNLNLVWCIED